MARIPGAEGFGEVVASPGPYVDSSPAARGAGLAQGLYRAASTMQAIEIREAAEARAARDAADRAAALDALNYTGDDLAAMRDEVAEGVRAGTIDKREAEQEWQRRASERISAALEGVPQAHRAAVQRGLDHRAAGFSRDVGKAVLARDRSEVAAGINGALEHAQRLYKTDPIGAEEKVHASLVALGPAAGLTPEQIGQKRQAWRESAQYTSAFEAVSAGRDSRSALDAAEKALGSMDALDPQKKVQLQDRIGMYRIAIDNREAAARERQRSEEERRMRIAEHSFNAFQTLADKGTALAPEYINATLAATSGTPYEAAVRGLAEQAKETGGLAARSPTELGSILRELDTEIAQKGRSPALDKRREQVEKVLASMENDMREDPLPAALERGWITEIPQVDASSPAALARTVAARLDVSNAVGMKLGRPVSPLQASEAAMVKQGLDLLPAKERASAVAMLATTLGPQASAGLAAQLDPKDRPLALAFGFAGARTPNGALTSELVLRGAQAIKDGTASKDEAKVTGWKASTARELEGVYPTEQQRQAVADAAYYITGALAADRGGYPNSRDVSDAVEMAVGGEIIEHNGRRIPLTGITEDGLEARLKTITEADLQLPDRVVRAGGVAMAAADFVKALPGQQLMYAGPGRYAVIVQGRPVTTSRGAPVIITVPR